MKSKIVIHSDGAYSRSRNVGAYAFIAQYLVYNDEHDLFQLKKESSFSQMVENTTNNRMELLAVIEALKFIKKPCEVEIISDATYVVNTVNIWINKFANEPNRLNLDLMKELHTQINRHKNVKAIWVRGHNNDPRNERVNELAQKAAGTWRGR